MTKKTVRPVCRHDPNHPWHDFKLKQEYCDRCGSPLVLREIKPYRKHCDDTGKRLTRFTLVCPKSEGFWYKFFSAFIMDGHTTQSYGNSVECHVVDKYRVEVV